MNAHAMVTIDVRVSIPLREGELNTEYVKEHEGNIAGAFVLQAREDLYAQLKTAGIDAECVTVADIEVVNACAGCENNGVEFTTSMGVSLCGACVQRALVFIAIRDVINNIGDIDVPLARALQSLEDDDYNMRENHPFTQHIDSESAAWDMFAGDERATVNELDTFMPTLAHAIMLWRTARHTTHT